MAAALIGELVATDLDPLIALTAAARVFRPVEVEVAREVLAAALTHGDQSGYRCAVARSATTAAHPAGYAVWGPTPCTEGTFDLYWLVVHPAARGRGVAGRLLAAAVTAAREEAGRQLVAETSGGPEYAPAQRFYERHDFRLAARLPDYYRPGDPKLIYIRPLLPHPAR